MPQGSTDLPMTVMGQGSSPKILYVYFLLNLCRDYFNTMRTGQGGDIDAATAALVAFCPDKKERERIWKVYTSTKDRDGTTTASVMAVGELITYLSDTLEFTEKSTGGFL